MVKVKDSPWKYEFKRKRVRKSSKVSRKSKHWVWRRFMKRSCSVHRKRSERVEQKR